MTCLPKACQFCGFLLILTLASEASENFKNQLFHHGKLKIFVYHNKKEIYI